MNNSSSDELKDGLQTFRRNRTSIITIMRDTINLFEKVSEKLSPEVLKCFDTTPLTSAAKQLGVVNINTLEEDIDNPAIAILGMVKAGKSSFINSLLKKSVVPSSNSSCTARLTRLYYSRNNVVKIVNQSGVIEKNKRLSKRKVPERYVKLSEEERKMPDKVNSIVHIGVNINFLKSGIDIIDSPGFGENITLTTVSKGVIKNVLPFVVYVIDGCLSVRRTDIADIIELKSMNPQVEIIYFVTKLDTDDDEELRDASGAIANAKYKMELAFKTLQRNNLLSNSIRNWSDCANFHGASLIRRSQYLNRRVTPETTFHYEQFCKFEKTLLAELLSYFRNQIDSASDHLIEFIMAVLAKIINYAQNFADKVHENQTQIHEIKTLEEELYEKIKQAIKNSGNDLRKRLMESLKENSDKIINPIKDAEYPLSIAIPLNGIVTDPGVIKQCQLNIRMVLVQGLETVIKDFVDEELFKKYRQAVENKLVLEQTNPASIKDGREKGKTPYQRLLEKTLDRNYRIESTISNSDSGTRNTTIEFMNVILISLKDFLSNIFPEILKNIDVDVNNPAWKLKQAQEVLHTINIHLLAEDVCKKLIEDFQIKHEAFLVEMEKELIFIRQRIENIDEIRKQAIETAPVFFQQLLNTVAIKGNYQFHGVEDLRQIGKSSQGVVFRSILNGKVLARKEIKTDRKDKDDQQRLRQKCAEELYYSLLLSHNRILPILGVTISETNQSISIYYPFMKSNLEKHIDANVLSQTDKQRIGYQVAEGLKYLHDHNIMHRDLRMENVMIDENNNVFLSDFEYIKSEALTNYTVNPCSAPEIMDSNICRKTIDIYSYGTMMSFLFRSKGRVGRVDHVTNIDALVKQMTHEMVHIAIDIPQDIYQLIIKCCNPKPSERPTIDQILDVLGGHIF